MHCPNGILVKLKCHLSGLSQHLFLRCLEFLGWATKLLIGSQLGSTGSASLNTPLDTGNGLAKRVSLLKVRKKAYIWCVQIYICIKLFLVKWEVWALPRPFLNFEQGWKVRLFKFLLDWIFKLFSTWTKIQKCQLVYHILE